MNTLFLFLWAALGGFYLVAALAVVLGRPLGLRLAAPSFAGNLLMAICFLSFLGSRLLGTGSGAVAFGYTGFVALFAALAIDVVRRGRGRRSAERGDGEPS